MKLGAGYPMGPFELADYVGHDTTYFILKGKSRLRILKYSCFSIREIISYIFNYKNIFVFNFISKHKKKNRTKDFFNYNIV